MPETPIHLHAEVEAVDEAGPSIGRVMAEYDQPLAGLEGHRRQSEDVMHRALLRSWKRSGVALRSLPAMTLVVLGLGSSPARASWPLQGLTLNDAFYGSGTIPQFAHLLAPPSGDVYVAAGNGGGNGQHWYVQRVAPAGGIAAGWPSGALPSGGAFLSHGVGTQGFAVDAAGTWWHAWKDGDLRLQAVHADAARTPLPAGSWWSVGHAPYNPSIPRLASDGAGGIYVAAYTNLAQIRLHHLLADGSTAPGWSPRGRRIGMSFSLEFCHLLPDGSGGVVIAWPDLSAGGARLRALRVMPDTTIAAGWPASGLLLGDGSVGPVDPSHPPYDMLVPSGPEHFVVGWTDASNSASVRVYLQRFHRDGTLDPAWPGSGLEVVTPGSLAKVTLVPDGLSGVHVLWENAGVPRTTRVLASGQFAPGHDAQGVPLVDAAAVYRSQSSAWGTFGVDRLTGTTGPDGGLVFAWTDFREPASAIRVRWLLANGVADPAEDPAGRAVGPSGIGNVIGILPDGSGGAYVAWWLDLSGETFVGLETRLTRAERGSTVGVPAHPGRGPLALHAAVPNPARRAAGFQVWLPDDVPARLDLFDLSGRVCRSTPLRGAGSHTVRFEDLGTLAPGLYFGRLVQEREQRESRVVIAR